MGTPGTFRWSWGGIVSDLVSIDEEGDCDGTEDYDSMVQMV